MIKNNYQNMPHKWILLFIHVDWLASSEVIGQRQSEKTLLGPIFFGDQVFDWQVVHHLLGMFYGYFLLRSFRSNSTVFTWLLKNPDQSNYIANHKWNKLPFLANRDSMELTESFTVFHKPMRSKSWSNLVFSLKQWWSDTNQNQHYTWFHWSISFGS